MKNKSYKSRDYKIFQTCLLLGLLGLLDIATQGLVKQIYGIADTGYIKLAIVAVPAFLFGSQLAAVISAPFIAILGLSPLLLVLAYFENKRYKAIENPRKREET